MGVWNVALLSPGTAPFGSGLAPRCPVTSLGLMGGGVISLPRSHGVSDIFQSLYGSCGGLPEGAGTVAMAPGAPLLLSFGEAAFLRPPRSASRGVSTNRSVWFRGAPERTHVSAFPWFPKGGL